MAKKDHILKATSVKVRRHGYMITNQGFKTTFQVIPLHKNFQKKKASPHQGNWSSHMHLHVHHNKYDHSHKFGP